MIPFEEFTHGYKNEDERLKMKQFFTDNIHRIDRSKKTILFSTPSETGTSHFRILEPLRAIYNEYPDKYNLVYTERLSMDMIQLANLIVQHRAGLEHTRMLDIIMKTPHRKNCKIIHDVDDNEIEVPESNPLHGLWMASGKDKMSEFQLKNCNYITTTTKSLKTFFRNYNNNVKIIRNAFDWNLPHWNKEKEKKEGKIVIGWAGLTSHMKDIEKMHPILKAIHDKYPNTHFILAGMPTKNSMHQIVTDPKTGQKIVRDIPVTDENKTYKGVVKKLYSDFDQNRIEFLDVLTLSDYGTFYSKFDIGIAYIESIKFDKGKSEIKVVEYAKYGVFPIFSKVGGYDEFYSSLPNDLKDIHMPIFSIPSKEEWIRKISYAVENIESLKEKFLPDLKKHVEDKYSIRNTVGDRISLYEELMR